MLFFRICFSVVIALQRISEALTANRLQLYHVSALDADKPHNAAILRATYKLQARCQDALSPVRRLQSL